MLSGDRVRRKLREEMLESVGELGNYPVAEAKGVKCFRKERSM